MKCTNCGREDANERLDLCAPCLERVLDLSFTETVQLVEQLWPEREQTYRLTRLLEYVEQHRPSIKEEHV